MQAGITGGIPSIGGVPMRRPCSLGVYIAGEQVLHGPLGTCFPARTCSLQILHALVFHEVAAQVALEDVADGGWVVPLGVIIKWVMPTTGSVAGSTLPRVSPRQS